MAARDPIDFAAPAVDAPTDVPAAPAPRAAGPLAAGRPAARLYRVVEVVRDEQGRLVRHGQIWQPDLDRARRFGRVLAVNSAAEKVVVADESGGIVEAIAEPAPDAPAPGWQGWRDLPLPPVPSASAQRLWRRPAPKPVLEPPRPDEFPVLADEVSEVESTRPLPPGTGLA